MRCDEAQGLLPDRLDVAGEMVLQVRMQVCLRFLDTNKAECNVAVICGVIGARELRKHKGEVQKVVSAKSVAGNVNGVHAVDHPDLLQNLGRVGG